MVDRWLILVMTQFVSAAIGFTWGFVTGGTLFIYVGGFFFALGVFAVTRWGYDRWKAKSKPKRRR
jgi:hypothetical protein